MPVFISYSHSDEEIVNKLAINLVARHAHVWIDKWELNVGDSIIQRVQEAIKDAGALLVILSKTSVESEWCKKELSAGLMRELEERRVVVLPVLVENCNIPIFLKEKVYADLRTNFDNGLESILSAIARVTNTHQSRIESGDGFVDWAEDWGYEGDFFSLRFTIVNPLKSCPMTILTTVRVTCDDVATRRYQRFEADGLDRIGRSIIGEILFELGDQGDFRLVLDDQFPKRLTVGFADEKNGAEYTVEMECRKLGDDNGKDQIVDLKDYLQGIQKYLRAATKKPSDEELSKMFAIISRPWTS
ncbi:MAG: toll/interleukin-1 receptor domain-containing protein [Bacilli bacterium]|jgi:hypothetical protein